MTSLQEATCPHEDLLRQLGLMAVDLGAPSYCRVAEGRIQITTPAERIGWALQALADLRSARSDLALPRLPDPDRKPEQ